MHGSQRESITGNAKNVKTDLKEKERGGGMQKGHGVLKEREQRKMDTEREGREGETYRKRERESRGPALNTDNRDQNQVA